MNTRLQGVREAIMVFIIAFFMGECGRPCQSSNDFFRRVGKEQEKVPLAPRSKSGWGSRSEITVPYTVILVLKAHQIWE